MSHATPINKKLPFLSPTTPMRPGKPRASRVKQLSPVRTINLPLDNFGFAINWDKIGIQHTATIWKSPHPLKKKSKSPSKKIYKQSAMQKVLAGL